MQHFLQAGFHIRVRVRYESGAGKTIRLYPVAGAKSQVSGGQAEPRATQHGYKSGDTEFIASTSGFLSRQQYRRFTAHTYKIHFRQPAGLLDLHHLNS